jgi:hypothetical protein
MLAVIGPAFALDTEKGVDFMLIFFRTCADYLESINSSQSCQNLSKEL